MNIESSNNNKTDVEWAKVYEIAKNNHSNGQTALANLSQKLIGKQPTASIFGDKLISAAEYTKIPVKRDEKNLNLPVPPITKRRFTQLSQAAANQLLSAQDNKKTKVICENICIQDEDDDATTAPEEEKVNLQVQPKLNAQSKSIKKPKSSVLKTTQSQTMPEVKPKYKKQTMADKLRDVNLSEVKVLDIQYPKLVIDRKPNDFARTRKGEVITDPEGNPYPRAKCYKVQAIVEVGGVQKRIKYQIGNPDQPDYTDTQDPRIQVLRGKFAKGYDTPLKRNYWRHYLKNTKPTIFAAYQALCQHWGIKLE